MNKKAQLDFGEINPLALAFGLIGGVVVYAMMGNTGGIKVGLFWRILGLIVGAIGGFFIFNAIIDR